MSVHRLFNGRSTDAAVVPAADPTADPVIGPTIDPAADPAVEGHRWRVAP